MTEPEKSNYPRSNRTDSTGDAMTLTNATNPRSSVDPTVGHGENHVHIKGSGGHIDNDDHDTSTEKLSTTTHSPRHSTHGHDATTAAATHDNTAGKPSIEMLHERKSSVLRPPLPPLPFHLKQHKLAVFFVFLVMFVDHGIFPPVFYFAFRYAAPQVSLTTVFGVITAIFGIVLGIECLVRGIKLVLKDPKYRPLGQEARFGMDFFSFSFTAFLIVNVVCVSTGTALEPPFINLMAMPMPTIVFNLSWAMLLSDYLHDNNYRAPFRMSSTPKGARFPRYIYIIIEDVIAVDCNGKREWRQAWKDRVEASKPMRETLRRLSMFWAISGLCVSAICWGVLWGFDSVSGKEAGYAIGWLLPWAWIIPATVMTTFYVKKRLKDERHFVQRDPSPHSP